VDEVLAGAPVPVPEEAPHPIWGEVWAALAGGDADDALRRIDAMRTPPTLWDPYHRRLGDILEKEVALPAEPQLDVAGVKQALRGAPTEELPRLARRIDTGDARAVGALVKAC